MTHQLIRRRRTHTARELSARFGIHARTVRRHVAEPRDDYETRAKRRRAIAAAMYAGGANWADIARAVGGSEWAARALVKRSKADGLHPRPSQTIPGV